MTRRCRKCGVITGGLIGHPMIPIDPWPQPDLCPQCDIIGPLPEPEIDTTIRQIIERARKSVLPQIERERVGEHIGQGLMEFRMR